MKKLLLILLCLPMIGFGQQTYVPDDNFEQALIDIGYDNVLDDYVTTANINTVIQLAVTGNSIEDLTGIEDFTSLNSLDCSWNFLTSLDVSNNTSLTELICKGNSLTSLDVSNNTSLTNLRCGINELSSIDVSQHIYLEYLFIGNNLLMTLDISNTNVRALGCEGNQLTQLDVSNNQISYLQCQNNQLNSLDLRNGFNTILSDINTSNNPNLSCIDVDDHQYSIFTWVGVDYVFDNQHYFSNNCSGATLIQEQTTNKELLKVTDLLGRETKQTKQPLFYIYDDGTVDKRIVIE